MSSNNIATSLDFRHTLENALRINASKGNAPGFQGQFSSRQHVGQSKTPDLISINTQPGPDIPQFTVKPPWKFDGMIPDVSFADITDSRQTNNLKLYAVILLVLGVIMAFGPK